MPISSKPKCIKFVLLSYLIVFHNTSFARGGNIQAGAGYSDDRQQIVSQPCFNAFDTTKSVREGQINLATAMCFDDSKQKGNHVSR